MRAQAEQSHAAMFPGARPTAVAPLLKHPHRALPPGKQWVAHDKPGGSAARRRLRQQARLELKRLRKSLGSSAVSGQDGDALLLDFAEPTRAK